MNEPRNFSEIPASACLFTVGDFELGDNGDGAKSAPVRLLARSGQPIEHPYWGRIVHDMAGVKLHKSRLAIDYVHDSKEVIGYLNKFENDGGDLITSGALVPFKDTDRATEILHKMKQGVPYEASINFGGDGIKVQELSEGEVSEVNGYQFDGPGVIVREWPLRGVAICPYGADMNTESAVAFSNSKQVFSASVISEPEAATEEGSVMSESVEVAAEVEVAPEAAEMEQAEKVEEAVEVVEGEVEDVVEEETPAELAAEAEVVEGEVKDVEFSASEFAKIVDAFGAEIAAQTVRESGSYETALKLHADALEEENKVLKVKISEFKSASQGTPAKAIAFAEPKKSLIVIK